jgi:hypothetical protein
VRYLLERAGDAFGAVLGPLLALALIALGEPAHRVMLLSIVPGVLAFLAMVILVVESPRDVPPVTRTFRASLTETPSPFRRYLGGILLFGCGDFSRTMLILHVTRHAEGALFGWEGATLSIALYARDCGIEFSSRMARTSRAADS